MIPEEEVLARAATLCLRQFPKEWGAFMDAVEGYAYRCVMNCIRAPVTELQRDQGKAQALQDLVRNLREAPQTMERIEKRERLK